MAAPAQYRQQVIYKCSVNVGLLFLLYLLILFTFEVVILKIIYNMASSNLNLTLKVKGNFKL